MTDKDQWEDLASNGIVQSSPFGQHHLHERVTRRFHESQHLIYETLAWMKKKGIADSCLWSDEAKIDPVGYNP